MAAKLGESLDKRFAEETSAKEGKKNGENESRLRENIESLVVSHVRAINFRYKARAVRFLRPTDTDANIRNRKQNLYQ